MFEFVSDGAGMMFGSEEEVVVESVKDDWVGSNGVLEREGMENGSANDAV